MPTLEFVTVLLDGWVCLCSYVNITIFCLDDEVKLLKNYYMHSNDFKSFVFSHSFMVNINLCEIILYVLILKK